MLILKTFAFSVKKKMINEKNSHLLPEVPEWYPQKISFCSNKNPIQFNNLTLWVTSRLDNVNDLLAFLVNMKK